MESTALADLPLGETIREEVDWSDPEEIFLNPEYETSVRLEAYRRCLQPREIFGKLFDYYQLSPLSIQGELLGELSRSFDETTAVQIILTLHDLGEEVDRSLALAVERLENRVTEAINFITLVRLLAQHQHPQTLHYLYQLIDRGTKREADWTFLYRQIFSLRTVFHQMVPVMNYFFTQVPEQEGRLTVLSGQYLLVHASDPTLRQRVIMRLLALARNEEREYNYRADAADCVYSNHRPETEQKEGEEALSIIQKLGGEKATLAENKQNLHFVDVSRALETLLQSPKSLEKFGEISEKILLEVPTERQVKIRSALARILLDAGVYGSEKVTAEEILLHLWGYLQNSPHRDELLQRLREELYEMDETCSSGHAFRLLNVISGFEESAVRMTFEQQIRGNLQGRLEARIRQISDPEFQGNVLLEMVADTPLARRPHFHQFYRENIGDVVTELRTEFVGHITEDEFVLFVRKALLAFEGEAE